MKGVILHGGSGTRLRPISHTGPKQLVPIANKPISQYVIEDLVNSGINQMTLVLGDAYPEKVKDYKEGKKGLIGLFMGEVMKLSKGKADPKLCNQMLRKILEK